MPRLISNASLAPKPDLALAVRILFSGGFILDASEPKPGYALLTLHRFDEFGIAHRYCFAVAENEIGASEVEGARVAADHHDADLIVVGKCEFEAVTLGWEEFVNVFGGPIVGLSPLESQFREHLEELGHNRLPEGLQGEANTRFEEHVRSALEFMIGSRVIPYGQRRSGEARPDGIVPPHGGLYVLYDAKAYGKGYTVTQDTLRQFDSYVRDFRNRYEGFVPPLDAFIVVSGHFPHDDETLADRSRDLYELCGVPLSFLTTETLNEIIEILADTPRIRRAVRWTRVFSDPVVRTKRVQRECRAVLRDNVIE